MKFDPPIPLLAPAQAGADAPFRFTLEQGAFAGQAFTATLFICPSPCCGCEGVRFDCQPATEPRGTEAAALVSPAPLRVNLSVMQRTVNPQPESTSADLALARAIVAELQPPDWEQWVQVFLGTKRGQMETMDLDTLEAWFPPEVMEGSATMAGYGEMFPWAESLQFFRGAELWMAEDLYCVDPACDCRTALLEFFRVPRAAKQRRRPVRIESVLRHDYVSGETTQVEHKFWSPAVTDLMAALRTAHPGFEQTCRERHRQMRRLARRLLPADVRASRRVVHARAEAAAVEPPAAPPTPPAKAGVKVGRNDPCPCGSGKKYKKCCG